MCFETNFFVSDLSVISPYFDLSSSLGEDDDDCGFDSSFLATLELFVDVTFYESVGLSAIFTLENDAQVAYPVACSNGNLCDDGESGLDFTSEPSFAIDFAFHASLVGLGGFSQDMRNFF